MKIAKILDIFKKRKKEPMSHITYGVIAGVYKGTSIIFFDLDKMPIKGEYIVLAIGEIDGSYGGMKIIKIPEVAIKEGFSKGLLERIGKLPDKVYQSFYLEYKERLKKEVEIVGVQDK